MKHQERNEDAASPVIGVMLMVVVTIVIAAVVTAFATGIAGDSTATTPMALLEADNPMMSNFGLNTVDIVHKGGDKIVLENVQVTLEPVGGKQFGIIVVRSGQTNGQLELLGKDKTTISTGDRIRVNINPKSNTDVESMPSNILVKWTVSDIRTNGVIAKGEFIVP